MEAFYAQQYVKTIQKSEVMYIIIEDNAAAIVYHSGNENPTSTGD